uniref:Uncharacterized protein n=4 Tax=Entomoneis paludosa TaxID=265537 RepID=A0A7S2VFF1_9STRA|mmetsp:Transcript_19620/g.40700  ORF Transcript_19620/g.40700 Transcript_19620/m.40700 type:complete len:269 (+) Transcript_19620:428-1234(+)
MGSLMAITSVLIGLYTIYTYKGRCLDNLTEEREEITFEDAVRWMNFPPDILDKLENAESLAIDIDWYAGPGLLCLVVATFLRILDTICNFIVPTPSITRGEVEQERYELEFGELPPEERRELSKKIRRSELLNPDMLLDDNFYRENSRKKLWLEPTAAVDSSVEDSPDQIVDVDGDGVSDEHSRSKPPEELYIETDPIVVEEPSQDLNLEFDPIVVEEPSEEWPMMENITVDVDRNPYDDGQEELLASLSFESSKSLKSPSFEDGHAV